MLSHPSQTFALVQKHDGYSGKSEGPSIESLDLYLDAAEIPLPDLADGQVLIKMAMASINPSDLHYIKGEYGHPRVKGAAAGFEGVGEVVAGNGSYAQSLVGKRVAFTVDPAGSGAWADYAITAAKVCIPVRDDMRNEDAAGHVVNPLTAMAMFDIVRKADTGSFIMTAANSQLCKLMIALGRDEGITPIAIVRKPEQAAHLEELGAGHVLSTASEDFADSVRSVIKQEKPRVLLDAVGNQVSADLFAAMPNRARWVVYGKLDPTPPTFREMGQFVFMEKRIEGFWLTRWFMSTPLEEQIRVIGEVQERFVSGKWQTEVSATIRLKDAMADLADALRNADGKVMLVP
ncbi:alcohol dehydrogenase catalytic domain-containing protein [Hoeflea sp.]|uniref:alcohol dehydrogenase catalytic domain-containing protein n=1 Tax=Hoeflea sp. TaxID=1940281 RepID=UPI003B02B2E5